MIHDRLAVLLCEMNVVADEVDVQSSIVNVKQLLHFIIYLILNECGWSIF